MTKLVELFGGENAEEYNALITAMTECAKDNNQHVYEWLEETPKTSLVTFLVDKLNELGYHIKR